eukprot:403052-Prorocentrum_minimum.AAC.1
MPQCRALIGPTKRPSLVGRLVAESLISIGRAEGRCVLFGCGCLGPSDRTVEIGGWVRIGEGASIFLIGRGYTWSLQPLDQAVEIRGDMHRRAAQVHFCDLVGRGLVRHNLIGRGCRIC